MLLNANDEGCKRRAPQQGTTSGGLAAHNGDSRLSGGGKRLRDPSFEYKLGFCKLSTPVYA